LLATDGEIRSDVEAFEALRASGGEKSKVEVEPCIRVAYR